MYRAPASARPATRRAGKDAGAPTPGVPDRIWDREPSGSPLPNAGQEASLKARGPRGRAMEHRI
jgi:hypothetical protein